MSNSKKTDPRRTDIQALRGLAVLQVLMFHTNSTLLGAGYLGVDVFFVISGFLITQMIVKQIDNAKFSFMQFYFRRAKRLLPAAYATFMVTAIFAAFLLDSKEWRDFTNQVLGGVTFTGNFVLWSQTGYFEGASALKPLLHIWTLSIEEQFYLLWPTILVFLPRRFRISFVILTLMASLGLCFRLSSTDPSAAFYLLPSRAWELELGVLAALINHSKKEWGLRIFRTLFWPALAVLLILPFNYPALPAACLTLAVCTATMIVILRNHEALNGQIIDQTFAKVGDFSYSLYLVHWPIFALINNYYIGIPTLGKPSPAVLSAAALGTLVLGYTLYRMIEKPIHYSKVQFSKGLLITTLSISLLVGLGPKIIPTAHHPLEKRDNVGFSEKCESSDRFDPVKECRNSDAPEMLIWGDSFAMHLVPAVLASGNAGIVQATKSSCGPLIGLGVLGTTPGGPTKRSAEDCLSFNHSVLEYIAKTPSIRTVVLSSPFHPYLINPFDKLDRRLLYEENGDIHKTIPSKEMAISYLKKTISEIRRLGRRVVIVAPPPTNGLDFTPCLERHVGNWALSDCNIPLDEYKTNRSQVLDFLKQIKAQADVNVISFDELLCSAKECLTSLDGVPIYRDYGHFSYNGAEIVGKKIGLTDLINRLSK